MNMFEKVSNIYKMLKFWWDWYILGVGWYIFLNRQIFQIGVIFIWNSQNGVFFYLFLDTDKSWITLWINGDPIPQFNLRLNEI